MIKKPITKKKAREEEEPVKKGLKSKKRAQEVDDDAADDADADDADADDADDETPVQRKLRLKKELAAKKASKKKKAADDDDADDADADDADADDDDAPAPRKGSLKKKKAKARRSLADVFDETKPGRGLMPVGEYKMKVLGFELEGEIADDPDEQGELKVKVTYEGGEDEEEGVAGVTISQWYQIADDDGEPGPGIPFLKGDLDILGYEDVILADLEEIFADVASEEPEVVVKVVQNGRFTNAYLQGLAETD